MRTVLFLAVCSLLTACSPAKSNTDTPVRGGGQPDTPVDSTRQQNQQ